MEKCIDIYRIIVPWEDNHILAFVSLFGTFRNTVVSGGNTRTPKVKNYAPRPAKKVSRTVET